VALNAFCERITQILLLSLAIASLLGGCAVGARPPPGMHLTATEWHDLAALKAGENTTLSEHQTEVGVLRKAGYDPSPF
jgi:hypothetical protein